MSVHNKLSLAPCYQLEGKVLNDGWIVKELLAKPDGATGGNFCAQYKVINSNGREAFLKALDFSSAGFELQEVYEKIGEYIFERDIYEKCKSRKMTRVVVPLAHGEINTGTAGPLSHVYYIIFELALGDIRKTKNNDFLSDYNIFKNLHGAAVGLRQLHKNQIAHQDIKPSNVLVFSENFTKVADLGRASDKLHPFKWDGLCHAGDPRYAPYERYWGVGIVDFVDRFVTDLFMLGNLIFFYYLDVSATIATFERARLLCPNYDRMTFGDALPYLTNAFSDVIQELKVVCDSRCPYMSDKIISTAIELCHPDPSKRGDNRYNDRVMRFDVQRYVSRFDLLQLTARIHK